jgi:hypothetical protein
MKFGVTHIAILWAVVGLSACATGNEASGRIPSGGDDCFWAGSIHDWKTVDDQTLIVWSPSRNCPYLVELARRCLSVRFTEELGFYDRDGRICPFGGDAIIVPGPAGDRCTIASIRRLTPEELEIRLADESGPATPSPEPGECEANPNTDD